EFVPSEPNAVGEPAFPQGIVKYGPTFDEEIEVCYEQVTVHLPLKEGVATPFSLAVPSQGCADAGLCYPPMTREITLSPAAGGYVAGGDGVVAQVPAMQAFATGVSQDAVGSEGGTFGNAFQLGDTGFAQYMAQAGWAEIIVLCFLLGVL